jgi:hypothetical protein
VPFISFAYDDDRDVVFKSLDLGANGFVFQNEPTAFEELKKLIDGLTRDRNPLNGDFQMSM